MGVSVACKIENISQNAQPVSHSLADAANGPRTKQRKCSEEQLFISQEATSIDPAIPQAAVHGCLHLP
jgi:hypothetical protein